MKRQDWMGSNRKALAIIRVSYRRQKDGISHEVQETEIREYCEEHGLQLVESRRLVESAMDSDNRTKYTDAIAQALRQSWRHVLFYMNDREARNLIDAERNEILVLQDRLVLHYVRDRKVLHKDSPDSDFLMRDFQAVTNKHYSRSLSSKVVDAMRQKAESGWYPSNNPPLGYALKPRLDANGREMKRGATIDVDPNEQNVKQVQLEFELRSRGFSYDAIRNEVVRRGFVPPSKIAQYRGATIQHRIANPFYWGRFLWKGEEYEGKHPIIIPKRVLELVGVVESGKKILAQGTEHGIFAGGWLVCADCGCNIVYDPKVKRYRSGKSKTYHYYHCTNGRKMHPSLAGLNIEEQEIWRQFERVVEAISLPPEVLDRVLNALNAGQDQIAAKASKRKAELKALLAQAEAEEQQLLSYLLDGTVDKEAFAGGTRKIRDKKYELKRELDQVEGQLRGQKGENLDSTLELCKNAKQLYLSRSPEERRDFLETLLSNPRLRGVTIEYDLKRPFDEIVKLGDFDEWRAQKDNLRTSKDDLTGLYASVQIPNRKL
jgi:DNA invertase Pin-like site-specific DNA recombinase